MMIHVCCEQIKRLAWRLMCAVTALSVVAIMVASPVFAALAQRGTAVTATLGPSPDIEAQGLSPRVAVFYYGSFNATVKQRLMNTKPAYVVLNTPGGSYKTLTTPTPADITDLKAVGIRVFSYISTGNLVGFKYAADSPPNDRAFVRASIASVAAEGCDGVYFDEGGVGKDHSHADRYLKAPALTMYGQPNSWAGYTIEDYASYTHALGLMAVLGTDFYEPTFLNSNVFDIFDFVLSDEHYTSRKSAGSEVGYEGQVWVIGYGLDDASTAAQYTKNALNQGFGAAYETLAYGSLEPWYETYMALLSGPAPTPASYPLSVSVSGQGTTTGYLPGTYRVASGSAVTIGATPAPGWVFKNWNNYLAWLENPTSWTMVQPIAITAVFEQAGVLPEPPPNRVPVLAEIGNKTVAPGSHLLFAVSAADPDGDALTYSASGLPPGASFDSTTHVFSWTPTISGIYSGITFQVSDGSLNATETITTTVRRLPIVAKLVVQFTVSSVRFLNKAADVVLNLPRKWFPFF